MGACKECENCLSNGHFEQLGYVRLKDVQDDLLPLFKCVRTAIGYMKTLPVLYGTLPRVQYKILAELSAELKKTEDLFLEVKEECTTL